MAPSKGKAKAGPAKGKSGKAKGNLALPSIAGVEDAAQVAAAEGRSYYTGPLPPASIYRVRLTLLFLTDNRSGDPRVTWSARIAEDHDARKKFNNYSFINGENISEQGLPYVNAMLDAMGLDREEFYGGGIKVDNPKSDARDNGGRQIVEAIGKQNTTESGEVYFYIVTKKAKAYNSDEIELQHQQYATEEQWEAVISNLDDAESDDEDTEDDETEVETDEDEEDDADEEDEDGDDSDDEEDDEDEDEDEDDEDEEGEEDDEEDDEDDEPDLTELSEADLKDRVVADKRWTDFTKKAHLKGYKKDALVDMLENGPKPPEKKGKKAKKGGSSKTPF